MPKFTDTITIEDRYNALTKPEHYRHANLNIKKQARNQAALQGFLALGSVALGRYFGSQNHPLLFFVV